MFSPLRRIFWLTAITAALSATPAHAASGGGLLTEVEGYASEAAWGIAVHAKALAAGDMAHIRAISFMVSGFIALIGLWLLTARPPVRPIAPATFARNEDEGKAVVSGAGEPAPENDPDRPTRLLEAIAAAKAQMSISEAEKKHGRS